ncbi:MAG: MraY family glycosyltransferase [Candidatus Jacksonbacteria bacterium]
MFLVFFVIAFILSLCLTPLIRIFARKINIQDCPSPPLKNHTKSTPLLGGVAIFFSFILSLVIYGLIANDSDNELFLFILSVVSCGWLVIGGILDDKYRLAPRYQIIWPILAALTVIAAGIGQDNITNPLYYIGLSGDPLLHLNFWTIKFFGLELTLLTDLFTFCWLMLLIYAMKLLDGLNGLVSGITVIGSIILFFTSLALGQSLPAILALIIAGAYLGFLPYNFSGKIFLGESGSTLAGFLLGVLAIMGPAKISITFLILGIPILDALRVIYQRKITDKKSPFLGDRKHLHFKLLVNGMSERKAVLMLWLICLAFGMLGLFFHGWMHSLLLAGLVGLMAVLLRVTRRRKIIEG